MKKTGFMCGTFDLLHAGHILAFIEAKQFCSTLVIGLNIGDNIDKTVNPGKRAPIFSCDDRKLILENIKLIDKVLVYEDENHLVEIIKEIKPEIRFLGEDYKNSKVTGKDLCDKIHYLNRSHGKSSSGFKNIIKHYKF